MKTPALVKAMTLTFSLLITSSSFATSGEGRNGPDQKGTSIPVTMDRMITTASFQRAFDICEAEANRSLFSQMMRTEVKDAPAVYVHKSWHPFMLNGKYFVYYLNVGLNSNRFEIHFGEDTLERFQSSYPSATVLSFKGSTEIENMFTAATQTQAVFRGGILVTTETKADSAYDELGTLRSQEILVTKYTVKAEPIVRMTSGRFIPTSLRLSGEEFNRCLQNNFR